jgi:hypothetical protein
MTRHPQGRHQHDVESQGQRRQFRARRQKRRRRAVDTPPLTRQQRGCGAVEIAPRLHLDNGKDAAPPGDDVDLSRGAAPVDGNDAPAAQAQMPAAQPLGDAAAALGAMPRRSVSRRRSHRGHCRPCKASARS